MVFPKMDKARFYYLNTNCPQTKTIFKVLSFSTVMYNMMPIPNGLFMVRMKIGCSVSVINDTPPQIPVRLLLLKEE